MPDRLTLRRDGPAAWRLSDTASDVDVGGIDYVHAADGRHYRPWLLVDGVRQDVGEAVSQLDMAAKVIDDVLA